jgi:glycyl-tRNA synthetase beta chain
MAKNQKGSNEEALLVELLTEELPPKSLRALSEAFASKLASELHNDRFLPDPAAAWPFATPRRLAVLIGSVSERSPDSEREVQGPPVSAPPQAVSGFAKKNGVSVESLKKTKGAKGDVYVAQVSTTGVALADVLASRVEAALRALPIPKMMRWGAGDAQFVRPVHGLVMLHGKKVIPGKVLGLESGNRTRGHRFMDKGEVVLARAEEYQETMNAHSVIASFESRKSAIDGLLAREAKKQGGSLGEYQDLLDEVTALVEHPSVYAGGFEAEFLEVPQECLILTMRQNQKYFPLFDPKGKLLPKFLIVSNMHVADPRHIIAGNERVVRPRLEDARFFFNQDRKQRLEARVPQLARVVYHRKLGSQMERVRRIQALAEGIARELKADAAVAARAAWLAKADLLTGMVGEFPELQGVMGRYYALHDGEAAEVASAIEAHYRPRFSGDLLPESAAACAVALADKADALVGLFGVGEQPSADKDPFGLRRSALGLLRILMEKTLALPLGPLLKAAAAGYQDLKVLESGVDDVRPFITERLRNLLREQGYEADEVEAVLSPAPERIDLVLPRLQAVRAFRKLPQAESLASANKRIRNILRKSEQTDGRLDESLFSQDEERRLFASVREIEPELRTLLDAGKFTEALKITAAIEPHVTAFFDKVMVNAEDAALRANRHALLRHKLDPLMNQVADISKLAVEK